MRTFLLFAAVLTLPACTSMLLGNTSTRETPVGRQSAAPTAADAAISGDIRRRLGTDAELSAYPIGIRTSSGTVTLSGTVGSYPLRDRAVEIARETEGVLRVDNRIVVNTNL